jgi:hypothetical protein
MKTNLKIKVGTPLRAVCGRLSEGSLPLAILLLWSLTSFGQSLNNGTPIRISGDSSARYVPAEVDSNTMQTVQFVRGDFVTFEVGLFDRGIFRSNTIAQFTNVTLQLFTEQNSTNAPLMAESITNGTANWNTNCQLANWTNGDTVASTNWNAQFIFSNAQTSFTLNSQASQLYWLRIFATTTNAVPRVVTYLESPITVWDGPISPDYIAPGWPLGIYVNLLGQLLSPTNFFVVNSNLMNKSVSGGGGGGSGTVTSVSGDGSVETGTITSSGTFGLGTASANVFLGGPVSGSSATLSLRAINQQDLPSITLTNDNAGNATFEASIAAATLTNLSQNFGVTAAGTTTSSNYVVTGSGITNISGEGGKYWALDNQGQYDGMDIVAAGAVDFVSEGIYNFGVDTIGDHTATVQAGLFNGSGAGLTALVPTALTGSGTIPQAALPAGVVTNGNVATATILATNSSLGTGITVYSDGALLFSSNFLTVASFTNNAWTVGSLTNLMNWLTNTVSGYVPGAVLQVSAGGVLQWSISLPVGLFSGVLITNATLTNTVSINVATLEAGTLIVTNKLTNAALSASEPVFTDANSALTSQAVIPTANLGSGTANSGTALMGNQSYAPMTNLTGNANQISITAGVVGLINGFHSTNANLGTPFTTNLTETANLTVKGSSSLDNGATFTDGTGDWTMVRGAWGSPTTGGLLATGGVLATLYTNATLNFGVTASGTVVSSNLLVKSSASIATNLNVSTEVVTNKLTNSILTVSELVGTDANDALTSVSIGSGLSLSGGTLTAPGTGGTVTFVTFTGDGIVDQSSPSSAVTTSGTVTASVLSQSANMFLAGPISGASAPSSFRDLDQQDLPSMVITNKNTITATILATNSTLGSGITFYSDGSILFSSNFLTIAAYTNGGWTIGSLTNEAYRLTNTIAASQGYVLQYQGGALQWINTNWMGSGGGGSFSGNANQFGVLGGVEAIIPGALVTNLTGYGATSFGAGAMQINSVGNISTSGTLSISGSSSFDNGNFTTDGSGDLTWVSVTNANHTFGVDSSGKVTASNLVVQANATIATNLNVSTMVVTNKLTNRVLTASEPVFSDANDALSSQATIAATFLPTASTSALGVGEADGATIGASAGVFSVLQGGNTNNAINETNVQSTNLVFTWTTNALNTGNFTTGSGGTGTGAAVTNWALYFSTNAFQSFVSNNICVGSNLVGVVNGLNYLDLFLRNTNALVYFLYFYGMNTNNWNGGVLWSNVTGKIITNLYPLPPTKGYYHFHCTFLGTNYYSNAVWEVTSPGG